MDQRPLDSSSLELCISSSGIAREMEQRPLDSSTLEFYISSSGIVRLRALDASSPEAVPHDHVSVKSESGVDADLGAGARQERG